jgi:hypothetical protein
MPQENPKKKSYSPAGLGAKLGSAVRESLPLAKSPAGLGSMLGAAVKKSFSGTPSLNPAKAGAKAGSSINSFGRKVKNTVKSSTRKYF